MLKKYNYSSGLLTSTSDLSKIIQKSQGHL